MKAELLGRSDPIAGESCRITLCHNKSQWTFSTQTKGPAQVAFLPGRRLNVPFKSDNFNSHLSRENRAYIERQIGRISEEVAQMSHQKPWAESMTHLMQLCRVLA